MTTKTNTKHCPTLVDRRKIPSNSFNQAKPGELLRFTLTGAEEELVEHPRLGLADGESFQGTVHGLRFEKRCSMFRPMADSWSKVIEVSIDARESFQGLYRFLPLRGRLFPSSRQLIGAEGVLFFLSHSLHQGTYPSFWGVSYAERAPPPVSTRVYVEICYFGGNSHGEPIVPVLPTTMASTFSQKKMLKPPLYLLHQNLPLVDVWSSDGQVLFQARLRRDGGVGIDEINASCITATGQITSGASFPLRRQPEEESADIDDEDDML